MAMWVTAEGGARVALWMAGVWPPGKAGSGAGQPTADGTVPRGKGLFSNRRAWS